MPTTHHHPLMKLFIKLMRVFIIIHCSLSTQVTILACHLHGPTEYGRSDFYIVLKPFSPLSYPLLSQFCMTQHSVCTSWHLNMWNVTNYRGQSLMPSAAVRENAVSNSFLSKDRLKDRGQHSFTYLRAINANCGQQKLHIRKIQKKIKILGRDSSSYIVFYLYTTL